MFSMEQEEYRKEKVNWNTIEFSDNLPCIDLIENPRQKSLFKVLDEECMLKSSDTALIRKLND